MKGFKMGYFAYLLTIVFVIAKIMNYVAWSWLVVFSPLIVFYGIIFLMFLFVAIMAIIQ